MIKKFLLTLPWVVLGFYIGIRFHAWVGEENSLTLENGFIFIENSIIGALSLAYDWVISLFKSS